MSYYQRKFHLRYTLPDGNIWKGFINVEADTREELHSRDEIRGSFWCTKSNESGRSGWSGMFKLDNTTEDRRKKPNPYGWDACITRAVVTTGIYLSEEEQVHTDKIQSVAEAEMILKNSENIAYKYETLEKFEGRLEDCIVSEETHCW